MIAIEIDDAEVKAAFKRLAGKLDNPRPLLLAIGEDLVDSTLRRFGTSTAPDGGKWPENSALTILRSGQGAAKKPLIGAGRSLSTQIHYAVDGSTLTVGSPMIYARVQQQGAKQGEFGRTKHNGPIPWGNIPPRPFLGISAGDREAIVRTVEDYLSDFTGT